jgi:hypothetical protein
VPELPPDPVPELPPDPVPELPPPLLSKPGQIPSGLAAPVVKDHWCVTEGTDTSPAWVPSVTVAV